MSMNLFTCQPFQMSSTLPRMRASCKTAPMFASRAAPKPFCTATKPSFSFNSFSSSARHNSPAPATQPSQYKSRARPFVFVLGLMPIFTFGLGTWQIQRLQWKLDMIDQLENKLHKDPVRLPARIESVNEATRLHNGCHITATHLLISKFSRSFAPPCVAVLTLFQSSLTVRCTLLENMITNTS